jgi:hypothetical protein
MNRVHTVRHNGLSSTQNDAIRSCRYGAQFRHDDRYDDGARRSPSVIARSSAVDGENAPMYVPIPRGSQPLTEA